MRGYAWQKDYRCYNKSTEQLLVMLINFNIINNVNIPNCDYMCTFQYYQDVK